MSGDTQDIINSIEGLREDFESFKKNFDISNSTPPSINERPYDMLNLPSQGKFYGGKESLLIRPLTFFEENILTSEFLVESGRAINIVLKNLIVDDDIDIDKLLPGDVQAITMFLRSQSYGDSLDMTMTCGHCNKEAEERFAISGFKMKEVKYHPNENDEFEISLPKSKVELKLRLLTFKEQFLLDKKNNSYRERLREMVVEANTSRDKKVIKKILNSLNLIESRKLRKILEDVNPGADTKLKYTCGYCGNGNEMSLGSTSLFIHFPYSHRNNALEEIFLLSHYGKAITWEDASKMSVTNRRWALNRLNEEIQKKNDAQKKENAKAKSNSR